MRSAGIQMRSAGIQLGDSKIVSVEAGSSIQARRSAMLSTRNASPAAVVGRSNCNPASPTPQPRPLRVGVLLDGLMAPLWVKRSLDEIDACEGLELVAILFANCSSAGHRHGTPSKQRNGLLFEAWTSIDYMARHRAENECRRIRVISQDYPRAQILSISTQNDLDLCDIERVRSAKLDVIVDFSDLCLATKLVGATAHGVLSFSAMRRPSEPQGTVLPVVWNEKDACLETSNEILAINVKGERKSLRPTGLVTDPSSVYRLSQTAYKRSLPLLLCHLRSIQQDGWDEKWSIAGDPLASALDAKPMDNRRVARVLRRTICEGVSVVAKRTCMYMQWFIAVRRSSNLNLLPGNMDGLQVIRPPGDRYWADPFLIAEDNKQYIFFEDYRLDKQKGLISYVCCSDDGQCGEARVALETDYHLSYPFLFRWRGQIYMMPETSEAGRIEVFRAVDFPHAWTREAVSMEGVSAYDPTLAEYNGKFWLFISGVANGTQNFDLWLFYSDCPFGPWRPHPQNPVVSDLRRARPAGSIFAHNGRLYRPGQDCSRIYGGAVALNMVETLTTERYAETTVGRIGPEWMPGNVGTHTFNQSGSLQVIDGRVWVPKWGKPWGM